MFYKLYLQPWA